MKSAIARSTSSVRYCTPVTPFACTTLKPTQEISERELVKAVFGGYDVAVVGGKGVSVVAGAMIAVTPITLLIALSIFFAIVFTTKIVSLGSIIAPPTYIIWTLCQVYITQTVSVPNLVAAVLLPSLIVWTHRTNIKRLLNGTEYKFGQNKDKK